LPDPQQRDWNLLSTAISSANALLAEDLARVDVHPDELKARRDHPEGEPADTSTSCEAARSTCSRRGPGGGLKRGRPVGSVQLLRMNKPDIYTFTHRTRLPVRIKADDMKKFIGNNPGSS